MNTIRGLTWDPFACRKALAKLLRFETSKSGDNLASLADVVGRMKPEQKSIYYISEQTKEAAESSPFVERLNRKDLEVLPLLHCHLWAKELCWTT